MRADTLLGHFAFAGTCLWTTPLGMVFSLLVQPFLLQPPYGHLDCHTGPHAYMDVAVPHVIFCPYPPVSTAAFFFQVTPHPRTGYAMPLRVTAHAVACYHGHGLLDTTPARPLPPPPPDPFRPDAFASFSIAWPYVTVPLQFGCCWITNSVWTHAGISAVRQRRDYRFGSTTPYLHGTYRTVSPTLVAR